MRDFLLLRATLLLLLTAAAWYLKPFGLESPLAMGAGAIVCALVLVFEHRIREITLKRLALGVGSSTLAEAKGDEEWVQDDVAVVIDVVATRQ